MIAGKLRVEEDGKVLLGEVRVFDRFGSRFLGLMGRKGLPPGSGVLLRPCSSVHTFFMRFPIDVVFLDKEDRVVRVLPGMKPWRVSPVVRNAVRVLESASGELSGKVRVGCKVQLRSIMK